MVFLLLIPFTNEVHGDLFIDHKNVVTKHTIKDYNNKFYEGILSGGGAYNYTHYEGILSGGVHSYTNIYTFTILPLECTPLIIYILPR